MMGVEVRRGGITPDERVTRLLHLHRLAEQTATIWRTASSTASAFEQVEQLSDELRKAGAAVAFEHRLSRRLLSLREALDSHLLTAAAIRGDDDDPRAARAADAMVQRGIDAVLVGLPRASELAS